MKTVFLILALTAVAWGLQHRNEFIKMAERKIKPEDEVKWAETIAEGLPQEFTWQDINGTSCVTKSWNQHIPQYCGSCWCFGATSSLSDRIKIARKCQGHDYFLSVQYILNNGNAGSCYGGDHISVYEFAKGKSWPYETCQPYLACSSDSSEGFCSDVNTSPSAINTCRTCPTFGESCVALDHYPNATVETYGSVTGAANMQAEIYKNGPIAGAVNANYILDYQGGVINAPNASKSTDHIISIVGWGYDKTLSKQYWIVRNSWGEYWGEMSYFRVVLGDNQLGLEGDCAYATASYATTNFPCGEGGTGCSS